MNRTISMALALGTALVGCGKDDGEDNTDGSHSTEDGSPYCEDTESPMALDDESSFGLTGQAFLDAIPGQLDGSAEFAGGASAGLQVTVTVDADSLRSVASVAVYPDTGGESPAIAVICPARVEVDAQMQLVSDDGQLAETLTVVLSSSDPSELGTELGEVSFWADLDPDALGGTLDIGDFTDLSEWDTVSMSVYGAILEGRLTGEVSGMGEVVDGDIAMAGSIPIASLDAVAAESAD
jgi:hypothetical protein